MIDVSFIGERRIEVLNEIKRYIGDLVTNNRNNLREECQEWIESKYDLGLTKKEKEILQYKLKVCDVIPLNLIYEEKRFRYISASEKYMFASTIQSYIQLNLFAPIRHDGTSTDFVMVKLNQIIKKHSNNPFERYVNTIDQNMLYAKQALKIHFQMCQNEQYIRSSSELPTFLHTELEELINKYRAEDIGTAYILGGLYA